jgi:hypothetical protein
MRRTIDTFVFLFFAGAAGCSSASGGADPVDPITTCPNAPSVCSKPIPSYGTVIEPILKANCVPCHGPTGTAGYSEATYDRVAKQEEPIFSMVAGCEMPPSSYPPLMAEQRDELLDWLVCGAPDN